MIDLFMEKITTLWRRVKARVGRTWRKPLDAFLYAVRFIGVVLFVVLFLVIFFPSFSDLVVGLLGKKDKQEVIKFIGWGIAGILAFFGAIAVNRRADAQVQSAKAQDEAAKAQSKAAEIQSENNKLIEKGHVQERFKAAAEHLGSEHEGARIASFYEFFYLALDNDDLRRNIFDILCAHLRFITTSDKYEPKNKFKSTGGSIEGIEPTGEVRTLSDILFQKTSQKERIFEGLKPNLRESFLIKINLYEADLRGAKLRDADLRYADLRETNLQGAKLRFVDLSNADLRDADLRNTENLDMAILNGAKVKGAMPPEGFQWPEDVNYD